MFRVKTYDDTNESMSFNKMFSYKRYFINNLDSYHGEQILKKVSKIIEKPEQSTVTSSTSVAGEERESLESPKRSNHFEIIGTVIDAKIKTLDHVSTIVPYDECLQQMLTCGTVIFDVSADNDQLSLASDYLKLLKDFLEREELYEKNQSTASDDGDTVESRKRYLILISTVMTWALTKPLDPGSSPGFWINIRRSGGNAILLVPKAWECEPTLPILGRGANVIPIINILDLAELLYNLITAFPKKLYILAVEQQITKQREIIKPLGRAVGSGMFKCIPQEDAFLIPEINQKTYDLMTIDLNMEPAFIVENMALQWTSELNFGENVYALMKQFKKERGLKPFKVIVYGPVLVGKTTLAKLISTGYGLVYVSPDTIADDILKDLELRVSHWQQGEKAALKLSESEDEEKAVDDYEEEEDDDNEKEAARVTIGMLRSGHELTEEEIIRYLRQRMLSHEAQNKGWVLDGFPNNLAQCTALFEKGDEQDDEGSEGMDPDYFDEDADLYSNVLKKLLPDIVVSLNATDEFLCEKAMRQPEGDFRISEDFVIKKLNEFRISDAPDVSPLNFFDELDIHPLVVTVDNHDDYSMRGPYAEVTLRMGRPCRYGKLMDTIEKEEKRVKAEKELMETKQEKALKEIEEKIKQEHEEKWNIGYSELYALMQEEEELCLAAAGEPMRSYLVQYIFPTLTAGLLEVAKLRPDDPIDFLAEYLFKLNPTGKMLEPGYNLKAEKILGKIKMMDDAWKDLDINIEPLLPPDDDFNNGQATTSKKIIDSMSAF